MARCLNCIHYDVCDGDRCDKERMYGECSYFLHDADVVPRAGFDKAIKNFLDAQDKVISEAKTEVVREIFEEIEELFRQHKEGGYYLNGAWFPERLDLYTEDAFEELKKKYAEGRNER